MYRRAPEIGSPSLFPTRQQLVLSAPVRLIAIGLGWVVGMVPVAVWDAPWWMGAAWLAASTPALIAAGPIRGRHMLAVGLTLAAIVSGWRLERGSGTDVPPWIGLVGQEVRLIGTVESEPNRGDITSGYVVRVESLSSTSGDSYSGGRVIA